MSGYEYEIQGNFGFGWEYVMTADNFADARERVRDYRANDFPNVYRVRLVAVSA